MFPTSLQRGLTIVLLIAAGLIAYQFAELALADFDNLGYSIFAAPSPTLHVGLLLICAAALSLIGWLVAASGNPLAGPFVVAGALAVPAILGGSIDGWLRTIDSSSAYFGLALEAAFWMVPVVMISLVMRYKRDALRSRLPKSLRSVHYVELSAESTASAGGNQAFAAAGPPLLAVVVTFALQRTLVTQVVGTLVLAMLVLTATWIVCIFGRNTLDGFERTSRPRATVAPAFLGGVVCVSIGTLCLVVLLRNADVGQVTGAMLLSFALAGMAAHQMFPSTSRLTILLSPLILAIAAYVMTGLSFDSREELLRTYFVISPGELNPLAMALPIFYGSAGVVGATLGIGWSQSIHASRQQHVILAT